MPAPCSIYFARAKLQTPIASLSFNPTVLLSLSPPSPPLSPASLVLSLSPYTILHEAKHGYKE